MTIRALVTGTLTKAPATKASATGTEFTTASIRTTQKACDGSTETLFVSVIAFSDQARQTLAALEVGDDVAMGGALTIGVWTANDGAARPQINLIADTVATTKGMKRPARTGPSRARPGQGRQPATAGEHYEPEPFNDPIAF